MFTGIVQDIGRIIAMQEVKGERSLVIETKKISLQRFNLGDSIAVQGVCLTVTQLQASALAVDVSAETLALTTLKSLMKDSPVNLEAALRVGDPLGGHFVSGHIDGVGTVHGVQEIGRSYRLEVVAPTSLLRYIAYKGSITLDGVSLTVNTVHDNRFVVNLIPHTWNETTLRYLLPGALVNIETDQMARYVERILQSQHASGESE
jgi:riboflavin synthase